MPENHQILHLLELCKMKTKGGVVFSSKRIETHTEELISEFGLSTRVDSKGNELSIKQKLILIDSGFGTTDPLCMFCNKPFIKFNGNSISSFCSKSCSIRYSLKNRTSEQEASRVEKIKSTNVERYGVSNVSKIPSVKEKKANTSMDNFGVSSPNSSQVVKEKIKSTNEKRYGGHPLSSQVVKEKIKSTNEKRYGGHPMKSKKVSKSRQLSYNKNNIKNYENYNEDYIRKHFISDGLVDRNAIIDYFGVYNTNFDKFRNKFNITEPYKDKYSTQSEIVKFIISLSEEVLENDRKIISPMELDLFLPTQNIAIEYNGLMFHSYGMSKYSMFNNYQTEDPLYHLRKTERCEEKKIQLLQIQENEWLNPAKQNIWKSVISTKLKKNKRIFARKCEVREVQIKEAREFLDRTHLQGYSSSTIKVGLYFQGELVSLMTFSTPRYNSKCQYEVIRFSSEINTTVVGGGSKLLAYFERKYEPESIISYANRRWSQGGFYEVNGFTKEKTSPPNFFYFKSGSLEIFSRVKFQKHKLGSILENFDNRLTASMNMFMNDYRRIWDAGNLVYIKQYER